MSNIPTNIRLPESLHAKIAEAAEKMHLPLADVIRQAISLGLHDLDLVNYDVDSIIYRAVLEARNEGQKKR